MNVELTDTEATKHRFSSDRPITLRTEDCLGRADFADSIAASIKGWRDQESLVIALYGAWGSGKSSIKNMVLESLRSAKPDAAPTILEFNPWQWAGQDQLAEAFFREVEIVLKGSPSPDMKKVAARWRLYAARLKVVSFISDKTSQMVSGALGFFLGTGTAWSIFADHPALGILGLIGAVVLLASFKAISAISELVSRLRDVKEAGAEVYGKSLEELKKSLREQLGKLSKPIVVIIDDIDRLTPDEIRLLFQLVKANADFPNVVYFLLFQRNVVERSLDCPPAISGQEFLEKIVQVGFDIPLLEHSRLEKVLLGGLDEFLKDEKVSKNFDNTRWGNLYLGGLRHYFQTLRDVYRYLAMLSFNVSLFRGTGSFEVNPTDLITLEVLRVFEPNVYQKLPDAKVELTDINGRRSRNPATETQMKEKLQALVDLASAETRSQVQEIIKQLFPPAEWVFGGSGYGSGFEERWFREQRVCHPDVFSRYFHLTIPQGDISQSELDRILSLVGDRDGLVAKLRSLNEHQLLRVALDCLEPYKEKLDINHAVPFVTALLDVGDELPEERGGPFSSLFSAEAHASRIIHWFLKKQQDRGKRGQILKEAMRASSGLYLPIMTVMHEGTEERRKKDPDAYLVTDDDLNELRLVCLQKIEEAAKSGRLLTHPHMMAILYRWREWGSSASAIQWAQIAIQSTDGAIAFLTSCVSRSTSQGIGDYIPKEHWRINLKMVEEFVSVDALEQGIAIVPLETQPEKAQKAIQAFKKAIKRHREGKSEDDLRGEGEDEDG